MSAGVLFSVVIPAYNAEAFIEDCVTSVCEQLFDSNRYEVIVVDDGSTDATVQKVRLLQEKYYNLKLICQENGRQGKARNTGVRSSVGRYILFLDSDDMWLSQNVFSLLYQVITECSPDYIFTKGYTSIPIDYSACGRNVIESSESEIIDADTCIASKDFSFSCWNYVYKREVFDALGVTFAENCFFEDLDFCVRALFAMGVKARVAKLSFPYYGYRENPTSTTRKTSVHVWLGNLAAIERLLTFIGANFGSSSSAMLASLKRCQRDMVRKPWRVFKSNFSYSECRDFYRRWREVMSEVKSIEKFREWVSTLPLAFFFTYGVLYRVLSRVKHMLIEK